MKFIMKPIFGAMALALITANATAAETPKEDQGGTLTAQVKVHHVVDGKDNGYDVNSGTAELFKLKYLSSSVSGAKLGMGFYAVGDLFDQTDVNATSEGRPGTGLYIVESGNTKPTMHTMVGELYIDYTREALNVYGGRMIFDSPLTTSSENLLPDFHQVLGANYKINKAFNVGLTQMTKMSIATRGANEFGLTGEGTGTGGITQSPFAVFRGEFQDISTVALGTNAEDTNGLTMINASYKPSKKMDVSAWGYMAHDIYNALYLEANHVTPIKSKKMKLKLSGQYLTQQAAGDKLATGTNFDSDDIDFNMFGLKAALGSKKWGAFIAMNQSSGDTGMFNAFSGDPGFTSAQFSRNEYRENVTAYKIGGKYKVAPKWTVGGGYANYGQSDTTVTVVPGIGLTNTANITGVDAVTAQTDATELDLFVAWKPTKKTMLKLTHAQRTSEYDGFNGADLTMGHTRLIAVANF